MSVHGHAEFLREGLERRALVERLVEKYRPHLEQTLGRPRHAVRSRDVQHRALASGAGDSTDHALWRDVVDTGTVGQEGRI